MLDFFAGSGTLGEAAHNKDRRFILIDNNPEALQIMAARFAPYERTNFINFDPAQREPAVKRSRSTGVAGEREFEPHDATDVPTS